ncbi:2-oxoisovalerate dehydrogenase [Mucilaginibacter segetis]|uniref:2-oxoisovalerate dehydrogenase n=1 Tax=Mucilaginibacter segetis TaxID=2793071 RepID=A0A934PRW7_9SPHI|nr:2-oxoisovalerate dehydrogenase [Mucilaginibacter segetis]MBK0377915.1 2-oxoisovalerate dehydrogenase [Mucilaginibacter segetis]
MNELFFLVEESLEGGYTAKAIGESIFTEGENMDELRNNIREAVQCHFDDGKSPKIIRLHLVKEEIMTV